MSHLSRRAAVAGLVGSLAAVATPALAQQLTIQNGTALGGVTDVVVGSFIVAFLTDRTDSSNAGGGLLGGGFGGRSTARSALEGVSDADFQRATDACYDDFLRQLGAAGYQVADRAPVEAAFRTAGAQPLENGLERDVILARNSRAKAKVFAPSAIGGLWLAREALGQISAPGFSGNRSAILISMTGAQHARSSRQGIVNVFYIVDFASAETYGGWFRNSSAVNVKAGLALTPEASKVFVYAPNGRVASFSPREPIAVGGDYGEFGDVTTGGHRAAELATNVIGALGGIGTNSTRRYAMTADPARWSAGVGDLSAAANMRMIEAVRTGR